MAEETAAATEERETDSQGRVITRGAHAAKAQRELDQMHWTQREQAERARKHAKLVPVFRKPSKMGAPSKYEDWMADKVFEWLTDREVIFTKKLVAAHLGIGESTLRLWQSQHADLLAAVAQGCAVQEAWLASQMADGMKYSASMYAVLKNLHEWKETVENTHKLGVDEALRLQAQGAKRVDWDRVRPDPLAAKRQQIIDAQTVEPRSPSAPTAPIAPTPTLAAPIEQIPTQTAYNMPSEARDAIQGQEAIK